MFPDRSLFPFESRYFTLPDGNKMHYVDEGSGPLVLLVHGTPEWSFGWRELIVLLRDRYRCVAPDLLGFGLSDKPVTADYSCKAHGARLEAFIEGLGLRDFHVVCNDFGLSIAMSCVLKHPDRTRKVSFFNGWMWPLDKDPHYSGPARVMRSFFGRWMYKWFNFPVRVVMPAAYGDRSRLTKAMHHHYKMALPDPASREAAYRFAFELLDATDWWADLWAQRGKLSDKPVLIFWGLKDKFVPPYELDKWTAALPGAEVIRFEDAGHFVQEEKPREMAAALDRFFTG
ncbi:MAG: alpha/beta fold hydrolase [Saprospiraceae bacterium]|nr:alpha/beta fold hydrolase [Saprospiraceae bacterium]